MHNAIETVEVRPLTPTETGLARRLQQLAGIIHDELKKKNKITVPDIRAFVRRLKSFDEFGFLDRTIKELEKTLDAHDNMIERPERLSKSMPELVKHTANLHDAFMKSDFKKAGAHAAKIKPIIDDVDHHVDAPEKAAAHIKSTFSDKPSFFGTTRLMDTLGDDEYDKIRGIDLSRAQYTAIDFPTSRMKNDLHYLLFFMLHLSPENKPKSINSYSEFRTFLRVKHANNGSLDMLVKLTNEYLHSNDKTLIPQILDMLNAMPALAAVNERNKSKFDVLYRGIAIDDHKTETAVIKEDKRRKYVATSTSYHAAKNFALKKGHLESEDSRRSERGFVITYKVTPAAILFDTKIIDTVFNESEILIDATKADVQEVTEV